MSAHDEEITLQDLALRLDRIERLLLTRTEDAPMSLDEAGVFLGLARSTVYKKTSAGSIKHFKSGKKLVFRRADLSEYLLRNPVRSASEIEDKAVQYVAAGRAR